jgi:DNA polymerase III subunit delta'
MSRTADLPGTEHQPQARVALTAALKGEDQLSHAYLFHGPSGTGKRKAARAFAATLLASGQADAADVERRVWAGVHPDLTWVEPRGAHDILVDDVRRRVVREVALRPFEASKRVFVIADAERMNEESQNALLKTLEEPSPYAHFVLVSSAPGRLLPTIPSRCRPVRFGPVPAERIAELLVEDGADPSLADACARLSGGDVQKARWLAGEGSDQRREAEAAARAPLHDWEDAGWTLAEPWRGLLERAADSGARAEAEVNQQLEELLANEPKRGRTGFVKEFELQARRAHRRAHTTSLDHSLELVQLWFRDLVAVASRSEAQVFNTDRMEELAHDAGDRDLDSLIACVDLVEETRRHLERNVLEDLALESLFNRLRRVA